MLAGPHPRSLALGGAAAPRSPPAPRASRRRSPLAMIRLLAVDIDGTLLDSRGRIPDSHRDALAGAAARHVEVALVTGRSFHFSRPIADALPFALTLVTNNGALVKDKTGRTHLRRLLPRGAARAVLEGTRAYEDSVALVFDRPAGVDERQVVFERMDWDHPNRRGYYEKNHAFIARTATPLADVLTEDPVQVMFNGSVEPMRRLVADLRALPIASDVSVAITEYAHRDFSLVDVNGGGCSKGTTLARWTAVRGFAPADVLAIGDNLNDVEMLEFAGTAVVMGNAVSELKARGWHVTGTNDEGGLADAIRRFL
jgi:Cof subfamily protein (haloacid dehalogenase superfamily)